MHSAMGARTARYRAHRLTEPTYFDLTAAFSALFSFLRVAIVAFRVAITAS